MRKQLRDLTIDIEVSLKKKIIDLAQAWHRGGLQTLTTNILEKAVREYNPNTIGISLPFRRGSEMIAFGVRVPPELKAALEEIVKKEVRTMRAIVDRMLREGIEDYVAPVIEEESTESKLAKAIKKLNKKQGEVFEAIANGQETGHHLSTIRVLMDNDLIERFRAVRLYSDREESFYQYGVPPHVQAVWCELCSEEIGDGEDE